MLSGTIEGLLFGIPYIILTSVGTLLKLIVLTLISLLTFNKLIKIIDLWKKENLILNLINPWNCLITILFITILVTLL
jgi:hypothetical protein